MSFLDDARDSLNEDEVANLKRLNQKSADFETTTDEEKVLFALKTKVKEFIGSRDRQKNLQVISGKAYSIKDILQVSGYDKKAILLALNSLFPREAKGETEVITTGSNFDYRDGKKYGLQKEYADFKKDGLNKAIQGLTDFGKSWIAKEVTTPRGKVLKPNKERFAKMFGKTVDDIDKINEPEVKDHKAVKVSTKATATV